MKEIKAHNTKFITNEKKKLDVQLAHNFVKVMNNKEKLTNNDKEKLDNFYVLGAFLSDEFEINNMRQWRAFHTRNMDRLFSLKNLEPEEMREHFERLGHRCRDGIEHLCRECQRHIDEFSDSTVMEKIHHLHEHFRHIRHDNFNPFMRRGDSTPEYSEQFRHSMTRIAEGKNDIDPSTFAIKPEDNLSNIQGGIEMGDSDD